MAEGPRDTLVTYSITEKTIAGVHGTPGGAARLVQRSGIAIDHSTVYSLSNISAKNYPNRLMLVETRSI